MNPTILIGIAGVLGVAILAALYLKTFGASMPTTAGNAINDGTDATGRTLRQRLDGSEASSVWHGII